MHLKNSLKEYINIVIVMFHGLGLEKVFIFFYIFFSIFQITIVDI